MSPDFDFYEVLPTFINKAKAFILSQKKEKPFFLYLPLAAPHTPWVPKKEYVGSSKAGEYGDFTRQVDAAVGELLKVLKEKGIEKNTMVIFTSDNGPYWRENFTEQFQHRAAGPFRGMKGDAYEGGHRIPFIVRWPGVFQAGLRSNQMINTTDIFATVASIVDFKLKDTNARDSYDMLPAMLGTQDVKRSIRPYLLTQNFRGEFQIREGNWKYINHKGSGGNNYEEDFLKTYALPETAPDAQGQLYNLLDDPGETTNLYFKEAEKRKGLQKLLEELKSSGRSAPLNRQPIGIERVRALGKQNIQKQQAIPE
jgi:arylsulfatase A-like enzyme